MPEKKIREEKITHPIGDGCAMIIATIVFFLTCGSGCLIRSLT